MAVVTIDRAPASGDFTALSEHQEQTPTTFYSAKPVLHLQCADSKVKIAKEELNTQSDFASLWDGSSSASEDSESAELPGVDVWVDSRHLTLWSSAKSKGVQIPYPTITLHAQDGNAVLLQLSLSDLNNTADEDLESLTLRILPTSAGVSSDKSSIEQVDGNAQTNGHGSAPSQQQLYEAISDCQELNPDPNPEDDEEGGGFDETAPGATGWITSENMADFMDENGNFGMPDGATMIGGEEDGAGGEADGEADGLGAGAGRRRGADEVDDEDGAQDETKWQRTG